MFRSLALLMLPPILTALPHAAAPEAPPTISASIFCPRELLLLPAAKGAELPYRGLAFAHTDREFPLGSMKIVNLSPYPVRT